MVNPIAVDAFEAYANLLLLLHDILVFVLSHCFVAAGGARDSFEVCMY